ncbi:MULTISPECIES: LysR family transcriptional regulator [Streptomyces]|uniref:LysR family transcriptional regulator n=1 Tax=Streptomyces TaxID=1883 RepID=UPI0036A2D93B
MSKVPDLESLRLLVLVGELGSLGGAATRLGIAQPSASKRLSTLERRLGLVLVDRTRRGSRLTSAGHMVSGWAQLVLDDVGALLTGAEALRSKRDAELRVAASMTVAEYLMPTWIGELRQTRPDLYVGLQVTNSEHVRELLHDGAVEMGFVESPRAPVGLSRRVVARDRLIVVVVPDHPWARRRKPLHVRELAATPIVVRERGSGTRETLDHALRRAGAEEARPLLELGSAAAVRGSVIAGAGPAVLSELAVGGDLAEGRLVPVEVEGVDLRRSLRAVWPAGRHLAGPAAELLAVAVHRARRNGHRHRPTRADAPVADDPGSRRPLPR